MFNNTQKKTLNKLLLLAYNGKSKRSFSTRDGKMFSKILIANRGEIACRVIETARKMGVRTVAVYSDIDKDSKHVALSDESYYIGPNPASESYLLADKILEICKISGAEAVHPGYGFLSENAEFSNACAENGIKFIGPPAKAIIDMGSKSASKDIMIAADVPVTPGYHGDAQDVETLRAEAKKMGYPIMIKAVLGGGGKGMRMVMEESGFEEGLDGCKREALKSFGDDRVLIERFLVKPRHVELQVFADEHGNCIHLYERDCSVQRRHQKVLEEAPAPGMTEELRARMGTAAVNAAKAVGYEGAGTVEFMLDDDGESFYFMEMNTRLQVEHPVTEMVTGVDLVNWQLRIAAGEELPLKQEEVTCTGHAIEARIYAENPDNNFLPASGNVSFMSLPEHIAFKNADIRIDSGVREGDDVSIFYDPMIAKLIVKGDDREEALRVLDGALRDYRIVGLPTNIEFCRKIASHEAFVSGDLDTNFIEKNYEELLPKSGPTPDHIVLLCALGRLVEEAISLPHDGSPWNALSNVGARFSGSSGRSRTLHFQGGNDADEDLQVEINYLPSLSNSDGQTVSFQGTVNGTTYDVSGYAVGEPTELVAYIGEQRFTGTVARDYANNTYSVFCDQEKGMKHAYPLQVPALDLGDDEGTKGKLAIKTLMPGSVIKLMVSAGDVVEKGAPLMILTAMKMEHIIRAQMDGTIESVGFNEGDFVEDGKILISFVDDEADD